MQRASIPSIINTYYQPTVIEGIVNQLPEDVLTISFKNIIIILIIFKNIQI